MAESEGKALFEECVFAFVISKDLTVSTAQKLRQTLEDHKGEVIDISEGTIELEIVTHIISTTSDFPQYAEARLHMIPVVIPSWITQSLMRSKLALLRPYTPDPNLIFSHVNVSCAGLPTGDKDAIIGAVLAMGGSESSNLTKLTSHICALDMNEPKCKQAAEKNLKCKIVLPHWFDDCLKLGKRIDERPYLLPDPEIIRLRADDPLAMPDTERMRGADSSNPDLRNLTAMLDTPRQLQVFSDKRIMLSKDLGLSDRLFRILKTLIEDGGGTVTAAVHKTDIYVCQYREGKDYVWASRAGLDVGNLSWLFHLITHNEWTSPLRKLLHYPLPKHKIPGFERMRITLSNYGGEARTYLENLVIAAGGEFTKSMKQDNTHLITARKNSEKCTAAAEWNINMANHLWLEESYAKCEVQSLTDPRYTHFPPRTNLGEIIGETQFDAQILEEIYFPEDLASSPSHPKPSNRHIMKDKDKNTSFKTSAGDIPNVAGQDDPPKAMKPPAQRRRTKSTPTAETVKTPSSKRRVSADKENDTPSTGSRSAKDKAMSRLNFLAPDIALYEKEKKRKGPVWGGERAANSIEKQKSLERNTSSPAQIKRDAEEFSEEEETETPNKRQKMNTTTTVNMRLLITGYKTWVNNLQKEELDKKKLRDMGIVVVQDPAKCSHLVAPSMVRTQKFLCALAHAPTVLSTDFIDACTTTKSKEMPDPETYLLLDTANEQKFSLRLREILIRAKKNRKRLLAEAPVYCTEAVPNGPDTYKGIIEANGGIFGVYKGKQVLKKVAPEEDIGPAEPVYLVSGLSVAEKKLWPKFNEMARDSNMVPRVVTTEWLLDVALSQVNKWSEDFLAVNL